MQYRKERKRIGVFYGGRSHERAGSLISGAAVIDALKRLQYEVISIDPGAQHLPSVLRKIDRAFIALHGWYGEDGKLQGYLETLGVPYTGSGVLASAIGMDKITFKTIVNAAGIHTPRHEVYLPRDTNGVSWMQSAVERLGLPVVIKPSSGGGSLGIVIAQSLETAMNAADAAARQFGSILIEEYIEGDFLTLGFLGSYGKPRFLDILRVTTSSGFYDYEAKHLAGRAHYEVPAVLPRDIREQARRIGTHIYQTVGCHGPARVDMILRKSTELEVLELNTVPGLSSQGNLARVALAVGISYDELIEQILQSCDGRPKYLP